MAPPELTRKCVRYPAGPLLFSKISVGGAVFLDDANRDDEKQILKNWAAEFPEFRKEHRETEKGLAVLWKASAGDLTNHQD